MAGHARSPSGRLAVRVLWPGLANVSAIIRNVNLGGARGGKGEGKEVNVHTRDVLPRSE